MDAENLDALVAEKSERCSQCKRDRKNIAERDRRLIFTSIGFKETLDRHMAAAGVNDDGHVLADKMARYIYHSRADSTNRKYNYSFKQFKNYCKSK